MKINFIRHGKTAGNIEKRYIGKTDESLCTEGISELTQKKYPCCEAVICSPMARCLQTALLVYPDCKPIEYEGLRECDFGSFEGKNYLEMREDACYQEWIDSGGTLPFPNGESPEAFKNRCCEEFIRAVSEVKAESISFIVHGGTIMAVMERFAMPRLSYFDYQVKCGGGYTTEFDGDKITVLGEI